MKVLSCAYLLTRTWVSNMLNATKKTTKNVPFLAEA